MSIRNNEDRFGAPQGDSPATPVAQTQTQMSFTVPTEIVALPSRGKYYPPDHPLYNKDTVEIRYMTARDEDILTSQTLLKKGVAIDKLIQNVVVDQSIDVDDLYNVRDCNLELFTKLRSERQAFQSPV